MTNTHCRSCGKQLRGRSDKKFCDDYCRNIFNNKKNEESDELVRKINRVLRRNRRILKALIPPGLQMIRISRYHLQEAGFCFPFFTHAYTNRKGFTYQYCYDHGLLLLHKDCFLVVKSKSSPILNTGWGSLTEDRPALNDKVDQKE